MTNPLNAKQKLLLGTALIGVGAFVMPTAAMADCSLSGTIVTCTTTDPDGYNGSATNSLTINVTQPASVLGTLSAGTTSTVNNDGQINVGTGNTAISVGGGSTVNNLTTATNPITGNILFGAAGTGQTNTLNNAFNAAGGGIFGDVTSAGGTFAVINDGKIGRAHV